MLVVQVRTTHAEPVYRVLADGTTLADMADHAATQELRVLRFDPVGDHELGEVIFGFLDGREFRNAEKDAVQLVSEAYDDEVDYSGEG